VFKCFGNVYADEIRVPGKRMDLKFACFSSFACLETCTCRLLVVLIWTIEERNSLGLLFGAVNGDAGVKAQDEQGAAA